METVLKTFHTLAFNRQNTQCHGKCASGACSQSLLANFYCLQNLLANLNCLQSLLANLNCLQNLLAKLALATRICRQIQIQIFCL